MILLVAKSKRNQLFAQQRIGLVIRTAKNWCYLAAYVKEGQARHSKNMSWSCAGVSAKMIERYLAFHNLGAILTKGDVVEDKLSPHIYLDYF